MNVRAAAKWAVVAGVAVVLWLVAVYVRGMSASAPKLPPPAFDVDVPAGQEFADASGSAHFHFDATVRLGNRTPGGMREVIVDVMVTNKTTDPVRHLSIGGILDDQVVQVIEAQVPFFGTATDEDHNLIPGQVPYGVSVSRIA